MGNDILTNLGATAPRKPRHISYDYGIKMKRGDKDGDNNSDAPGASQEIERRSRETGDDVKRISTEYIVEQFSEYREVKRDG